jgi:hypothetical protein
LFNNLFDFCTRLGHGEHHHIERPPDEIVDASANQSASNEPPQAFENRLHDIHMNESNRMILDSSRTENMTTQIFFDESK